jgi:hypothetical protein
MLAACGGGGAALWSSCSSLGQHSSHGLFFHRLYSSPKGYTFKDHKLWLKGGKQACSRRFASSSSFPLDTDMLGVGMEYQPTVDPLSTCIVPIDNKRTPKGVVHFLGGAFAGAAPTRVYGKLVENFVKQNYIVVSTAYQVTFKHDECAKSIFDRFERVFEESVAPIIGPTASIPVIAVGHSNGALMHALMASMFPTRYDACILMAFNNRQVSEAVPVPLTSLQELVKDTKQQQDIVSLENGVRDVVQRVSMRDMEVESALAQLGSVLDELSAGIEDFSPSPEENAVCISQKYSIPKTLLVQFKDDSIDQSNELYKYLRKNRRRSVTFASLPWGSHVSPVAPSMSTSGTRETREIVRLCDSFIEDRCIS